jgi:hypothetical protein
MAAMETQAKAFQSTIDELKAAKEKYVSEIADIAQQNLKFRISEERERGIIYTRTAENYLSKEDFNAARTELRNDLANAKQELRDELQRLQ